MICQRTLLLKPMRFIRKYISIKFLFVLFSFLLITFITYHISELKVKTIRKASNIEYEPKPWSGEVIHIGIVWIGYQSNFYLYTMLKSLYFYRSNPLHFHIIVDDISEKNLKNMFDKWAVPQVLISFYSLNDFVPYSPLTRKLLFPEIIPTSVTKKIIILETHLTFTKDVRELWNLFNHFKENQGVGLVENQNKEYLERIDSEKAVIEKWFNSDVILFEVQVLKTERWEELVRKAINEIIPLFKDVEATDQNILNAVVSGNFELVFVVTCLGNTQIFPENFNCPAKTQILIVNWRSSENVLNPATKKEYFKNLNRIFHEYNGDKARTQIPNTVDYKKNIPKHIVKWPENMDCVDFKKAYYYHWRTLLFFREFKHRASKDDVTLVSHLTYDRLPVLEILSQRWEGPISLALFITDSELYKFMMFVENSKVLQNRYNIAYHVIFKELYHHPINLCRNVALRNVVTPYVFLNDVDFIPMQGMYESLKEYVGTIRGMARKALIVPAFETNPKDKEKIPETKEEMIKAMNEAHQVFQVMKWDFPEGHALTDYEKWKTETKPYQINFQYGCEPYVVVQRNVTDYDERFVGYGWDKISFITKLYAQEYEFMVLPNSFIVHKRHNFFPEKIQFRNSNNYRLCSMNLMAHVSRELNMKYGLKLSYN